MTTASASASPRRSSFSAPAICAAAILLLLALGVSFALGRWSADPPSPPGRAEAAPRAAPAPSFEPAPRRAAPVIRVAPPSVVAPPAASTATRPEEAVARAADEVKAQIETLRPYIVSRCLPSGTLGDDRASATLTIDSTFDSQGREIARGISEDRRAPAGELAACLRQLQGIALTVAPSGANVGVHVPVAFP